MKQNLLINETPSRLFIYYNERVLENTVHSDSGAQIRDGIKTVANQGVCPEVIWPYVINKFANKPSQQAFSLALQEKAVSYQKLLSLVDMKSCLAQGYPFVFGFVVYPEFESQQVATTGIVPMPNTSEKPLGGHAVLAVGYDDVNKVFIVRNSWGTFWGKSGYFTLPYDYVTNSDLASDFWTIRTVN